jgi:hypothetical protein
MYILHFKYYSRKEPLQRQVHTQKSPSPRSAATAYWKNVANQRQFLDKVAIELGIQKPEEWHKVSARQVKEKGGRFIKNYYNNSLIQGADRLTVSTIVYYCIYADFSSVASDIS